MLISTGCPAGRCGDGGPFPAACKVARLGRVRLNVVGTRWWVLSRCDKTSPRRAGGSAVVKECALLPPLCAARLLAARAVPPPGLPATFNRTRLGHAPQRNVGAAPKNVSHPRRMALRVQCAMRGLLPALNRRPFSFHGPLCPFHDRIHLVGVCELGKARREENKAPCEEDKAACEEGRAAREEDKVAGWRNKAGWDEEEVAGGEAGAVDAGAGAGNIVSNAAPWSGVPAISPGKRQKAGENTGVSAPYSRAKGLVARARHRVRRGHFSRRWHPWHTRC